MTPAALIAVLFLNPCCFLCAGAEASPESISVSDVLDPVTFVSSDGRAFRYFGVRRFSLVGDASEAQLADSLLLQHRAMLAGKTLQVEVVRSSAIRSGGPPFFHAYASDGEESLNVEMLRQGLGQLDRRCVKRLGPRLEDYLRAQHEAGENLRGFWAIPSHRFLAVSSPFPNILHWSYCRALNAQERGVKSEVGDIQAAAALELSPCNACMQGDVLHVPEPNLAETMASRSLALFVLLLLAGFWLLLVLFEVWERFPSWWNKGSPSRLAKTPEPGLSVAVRFKVAASRTKWDLLPWMDRLHARWAAYLRPDGRRWELDVAEGEVRNGAIRPADFKRLMSTLMVKIKSKMKPGETTRTALSGDSESVRLTFNLLNSANRPISFPLSPVEINEVSRLLPARKGRLEVGQDGSCLLIVFHEQSLPLDKSQGDCQE